MDGHSSHYTADLLEFCLAHKIKVYGYPPHCTHALQGLDVVCFAKMKDIWKAKLHTFEKLHGRGVNKEDFLEVWGWAYKTAFTKENILVAFEATGIRPFNPNIIKPEQMKPAEVTSTVATFPLPQSSPTRRVITAFYDYQFTDSGLHPDSPSRTEPLGTPPRDNTPSTPKRSHDCQDQPDTPSKRMGILGAHLAKSASASMLVAKARVTHLQIAALIAPPVIEHVPAELPSLDWSLLHSQEHLSRYTKPELEAFCEDLQTSLGHAKVWITAQTMINQGQNAQLIIQNLEIGAINCTLHQKEKPKRSDRTVLKLFVDGKGRHLTDPEVIQAKRQMEEERKRKEMDKVLRTTSKQSKKAAKQQLEERWKDVAIAIRL